MKAYLIDAKNQTVEPIDVSDVDDVIKAVGYDTLESDSVGDSGDRLFFDEECFIRGSEGRFQVDSLIPVSGNGVVVGSNEEGTELSDVLISQDALLNRIKYL